MNSTIFPWKMTAIAATGLALLFVVGFLISGKQPVQSQQRAPQVEASPVVADSALSNNNKPAKKSPIKITIVQPHAVAKHKLPVNNKVAAPVDSSANMVAKNNTVVAEMQDEDEATPLNEMLVLDITAQKKPAVKSDNSAADKKSDHVDSSNDMFSIPVTKKTTEAHPQNGWDDFEKYLKDGAVSPDGKTGTVKLLFTVNGDGTFTDIKVKNSVSDAADKKAIELVKNGPAWIGNANKQAKEVTVNVDFH
jgi:TonB family protein